MNVPADGGGYHLKYVPTNYEPLNTMRMTEYVSKSMYIYLWNIYVI